MPRNLRPVRGRILHRCTLHDRIGFVRKKLIHLRLRVSYFPPRSFRGNTSRDGDLRGEGPAPPVGLLTWRSDLGSLRHRPAGTTTRAVRSLRQLRCRVARRVTPCFLDNHDRGGGRVRRGQTTARPWAENAGRAVRRIARLFCFLQRFPDRPSFPVFHVTGALALSEQAGASMARPQTAGRGEEEARFLLPLWEKVPRRGG